MKKTVFAISVCLTTACILFSTKDASVQAATQQDSQTLVKIEKGKTYQIKNLLKQIKSEEGVLYSASKAEAILKAVNKSKKVKLSGKGITVKKNSFKVKKEGMYTLKIKAKKKTYKINVKSVPKTFSLDSSKISRVNISAILDEPGLKTVEIKDPELISQIAEKMNRAQYKFNFLESSKIRVGFLKYYVDIYDTNNQLMYYHLKVSDEGVQNETDNVKWQQNSEQAKTVYQYLEQIFKERYVS